MTKSKSKPELEATRSSYSAEAEAEAEAEANWIILLEARLNLASQHDFDIRINQCKEPNLNEFEAV